VSLRIPKRGVALAGATPSFARSTDALIRDDRVRGRLNCLVALEQREIREIPPEGLQSRAVRCGWFGQSLFDFSKSFIFFRPPYHNMPEIPDGA
jgi:hypothetical protein